MDQHLQRSSIQVRSRSTQIGECVISTVIIIGGTGKAAVQKLVTVYPHLDAEGKAAAVALLQTFIDDVNTMCAHVEHDGQQSDSDEQ